MEIGHWSRQSVVVSIQSDVTIFRVLWPNDWLELCERHFLVEENLLNWFETVSEIRVKQNILMEKLNKLQENRMQSEKNCWKSGDTIENHIVCA